MKLGCVIRFWLKQIYNDQGLTGKVNVIQRPVGCLDIILYLLVGNCSGFCWQYSLPNFCPKFTDPKFEAFVSSTDICIAYVRTSLASLFHHLQLDKHVPRKTHILSSLVLVSTQFSHSSISEQKQSGIYWPRMLSPLHQSLQYF